MVSRVPTLVLVHGAWHGSWCWEPVVAALAARDVGTLLVELPSTLDGSGFAEDVAAVGACLDQCIDPVTLVAHSYGGAVATEAGEHPAVHGLVFVAGFNLTEDESAAAAAVDEGASIDHVGRPALELVDVGDGRAAVTPESARRVFFGDCTPTVAAAAVARLRPQQMSTLTASPRAVAWHGRRSTYVVCEHDQAVHPDLQRILARRATRAVSLPSGHSPFLSMPDRLAAVLADEAQGT